MSFYHTFQSLPSQLFSKIKPVPVSSPKLVIFNQKLAESLNIEFLKNIQREKLADYFSGNKLPFGAEPIAQAYAGHQFGHLNILGDGRAILLGEIQQANSSLIDIQLKGSGQTPYSRGGDGRASLTPMLREYLISEAMHALGIPTTRSLAVIETGEMVQRQTRETGAILTRTASSHIRVGTFIYANMLFHQTGNRQPLVKLLEYSVNRHYPELNALSIDQKALGLLKAVMDKQASLVANWRRVGFIHGVMNTDNITISAETIDYGPCAFLDNYNEATVFSSIDDQGRYAFKNQMPIMWWNMARFAESLLPLIHSNEETSLEIATDSINGFGDKYQHYWKQILCAKVGLAESNFDFAKQLLKLMHENKLDYTNTFKNLTLVAMKDKTIDDILKMVSENEEKVTFENWLSDWQEKVQSFGEQKTIQLMQTHNPAFIPRNYLVDESLKKCEDGDMANFYELLAVVQNPYNWNSQYLTTTRRFQHPASVEWNTGFKTFCGT